MLKKYFLNDLQIKQSHKTQLILGIWYVCYDLLALKQGTTRRYVITIYNYHDFLSMITPQNRGYNAMWHQTDFWYFFECQK